MYITLTNNQTFQAKKLIPLSQYQGPILKLTSKDKEKISNLLSQKTQILFELDRIKAKLEKNCKTITKEWQHLSIVESKLLGTIDSINRQIKEIKINRLNQQKKRLEKSNKKV